VGGQPYVETRIELRVPLLRLSSGILFEEVVDKVNKPHSSGGLTRWLRVSLVALAIALVARPAGASDTQVVISGGPDGTTPFNVTDDLSISVNGTPVYSDGSAPAGSRQPINLGKISQGDTLQFTVTSQEASGTSGGGNLIQNGNFNGLADWTSVAVSSGGFSGYPMFDLRDGQPCNSVGTYLGIDVPGGADGYVEQTITLPQGSYSLSFRSWNDLDATLVTISVVAGGQTTQLDSYSPPSVYADDSLDCTDNTPITKSYDLTRWAGQTITIRLEATSDGSDGTIANFTNVTVASSTCPSIDALYLSCTPGASVQLTQAMNQECGNSSPLTFTSKVPDLCSALSLTLNPVKIPNDGSTTYATVNLVDSNLKPVSGQTVTFSVPSSIGTLVSNARQTTDQNGSAQVRIRGAKTEGQGDITASDASGDHTSATLTILPPDPNLPHGLTVADTIRRPGETDRDVLERLYQKAIPSGVLATGFGTGVLNNIGAAVTSLPGISSAVPQSLQQGLWSDSCGGYQGQVLDLLNALHGDAQTAGYFNDLDYGPVQSNFGGHHAVVLYDHGTNYYQTGEVLDPWIAQRPDIYSWDGWDVLNLETGTTDTSTQKGLYPLTGGSSYPSQGSRALQAPHPYRPSDPPLDNETYTLQVVVSGPVQAYVEDGLGRINGLPPSGGVTQIPDSWQYLLPDSNGALYTYFLLTNRNDYKLTLTGVRNGSANVDVSLGDPLQATLASYDYDSIPVSKGGVITMPMSYTSLGQPLALSSGTITPMPAPPPGVTLNGSSEIKVSEIAPGNFVGSQTIAGTFVVTNASGGTAQISSVTIALNHAHEVSALTVDSSGGSAMPLSQSIGASNVFNFDPPLTINQNSSMGIRVTTTVSTAKPAADATLMVTAVSSSPVAADGLPVTVFGPTTTVTALKPIGSVEHSPSALDFGMLKVGTTKTKILTLSNPKRNTGPLQIVSVMQSAFPTTTDFAIDASGCTSSPVALGKKCQVAVTYSPSKTGTFQEKLVLIDNERKPQTISIDGVGK